ILNASPELSAGCRRWSGARLDLDAGRSSLPDVEDRSHDLDAQLPTGERVSCRTLARTRALRTSRIVSSVLLVLLVAARAAAQPARPSIVNREGADKVTVRTVRLATPLKVDGRLDESIYDTVEPISDFIQQEPREGEPATEKTDAWIFFDDTSLYIAARCWDSHPEREVANELRRD